MPKWLGPWLFPPVLLVTLLLVVLAESLGRAASVVLPVLLLAAAIGALSYLRLQSLKRNPPDPELTHKPFWHF